MEHSSMGERNVESLTRHKVFKNGVLHDTRRQLEKLQVQDPTWSSITIILRGRVQIPLGCPKRRYLDSHSGAVKI